MNKKYLVMILAISLSAQAEDIPCGRVTKESKHAQLIPVFGKVKTRVSPDDIVTCGSMLVTTSEPVWIETNDQTVFKIGPNSFFEISQEEKYKHQLYRGTILVTAPPSIKEFQLATPNSITQFSGGAVVVSYSPVSKETSVASFNRKVEFRNKFHEKTEQVVSAGEISKLWIGESRIIPNQPEVMNPSTVPGTLQPFAIAPEEIHEFVSIVNRVVESRSKSFIADLEGWEEIEREVEAKREVQRSIASIPGKKVKDQNALDAEEAALGLHLLKKRLYGDETDNKMFEDHPRVPASIREQFRFKDSEYQRKKAKVDVHVKKVIDDIKHFNPENE